MSDFIDFEAAVDDDDDIDDNEAAAAAAAVRSDNNDLIDDETQIDDNLEDYYAFTNVSRSVEDVIQDSFLDPNSGESLTAAEEAALEASNYCCDNYDPAHDETDEFRDSIRRVGEFKCTLFCPQGVENPDIFYYAILYDLHYKKKNSKDTCDRCDQLKQDIENDKLFEASSKASQSKARSRYSEFRKSGQLLNENNLFLRVYELKDKFKYLIRQDAKKREFCESCLPVLLRSSTVFESCLPVSLKSSTVFTLFMLNSIRN